MKKGYFCGILAMLFVFFPLVSIQAEQNEIRVGISCPLSGSYGEMGRVFSEGWSVYFQKINDQGGILGKKIRWKILDDSFSLEKVRKNLEYFLYDWHADILAGFFGLLPVMEVVDYLERNKVNKLFVFPMTGTPFIKENIRDRLYSIDPLFNDEVRILLDYFLSTKDVSSWAIVYREDPSILVVRDMIAKELARMGIRASMVEVGDQGQVASLLGNPPDVLILVLPTEDGYDFLKKLVEKVNGSILPDVVAISSVFPCSYIKKISFLMPEGKFYFLQTVPHPLDTEYPVVKEYLEDLKKYGRTKPCFISLHGYISAKLLCEMLKMSNGRAEVEAIDNAVLGRPITHIGVRKALRFSQWIHRVPVGVGLFVVEDKGPKIREILWEDFTHKRCGSQRVFFGGKKTTVSKKDDKISVSVKIQKVTPVD